MIKMFTSLIHDLARHRVRAQRALEEAFGRGLVAPLLQRHVECGVMLVNGSPRRVRFTLPRDEHLVVR
ncbi:hypothetical protein LMG29739_01272 [Paraburkholderia solisilvae]|uniref:Uncharacterized protein n=1 Tax=Paraburkholderia solisilvae TaxID=624376 RepID=A0A6J5DBY1_9BURK|nr:hypothetical protein LMG29739_01272 [Paraburkholderia solisilvae]